LPLDCINIYTKPTEVLCHTGLCMRKEKKIAVLNQVNGQFL
jgi:hypothetical protein